MVNVKARCWKPPGHYLRTPQPGRPDCVISIEIGVNGDAYPVAVRQKVTKNLPVSFYSPMPGFKVFVHTTDIDDDADTRAMTLAPRTFVLAC